MGNCPGGEWSYSGELSRMRIRPVGNCPLGTCPGGDLSCLGVDPFGNCPGGEWS